MAKKYQQVSSAWTE